jgi:hypothetical protein
MSSKQITITPVAKSTPFDNTTNGFTAADVQAAIEEAKTTAANASRGPTNCGFDGSAGTGRWLEFYANNPSNNNPFVIAEPAQLIAVSISAASNSTGTVTIFKNGISLQTISLSASRINRIKSLTHSFTDLDEISVQVTSGSISRPVVYMFIRTLP